MKILILFIVVAITACASYSSNRESISERTRRLLDSESCSANDLKRVKRRVHIFLASGDRDKELRNKFAEYLNLIEKN